MRITKRTNHSLLIRVNRFMDEIWTASRNGYRIVSVTKVGTAGDSLSVTMHHDRKDWEKNKTIVYKNGNALLPQIYCLPAAMGGEYGRMFVATTAEQKWDSEQKWIPNYGFVDNAPRSLFVPLSIISEEPRI